ncbi:cyclic nucleotide-binding domain-containing protein [Oceanibaculum indicum]|uniref:Transcriptional activator FtrB n=2 Tax=Oceanibaculum indicum TaxID=526216 RepID=K2K7V0_9PROT|nr:cyclic nucleotide-binding domain-containing protein [Oceanibaculum indicum]EKE78979.1 transcriptional activator FtrB [Oceanibaculum indicum P24]RKQ72330.1 CRP/FNR family transcriptional activator FtrB [Oceanibaculum indicum]
MQPDDVDAIRNLPLFRDCMPETFEALIKISFLQRFPQGVLLISENDPADFLHVVLEGLVEMFGSSGGRETTISFVRPVSTFILAAVLKDQVYLQSARTISRSRILMIPAQAVRQAMQQDKAFMLSIVGELATGYRRVVKELKNQKLRTSSERLANWLLAQGRLSDDGTVRLAMEKRVLASRLGMTPENLSRAFSTLRDLGVRVEGNIIRLEDMEALTDFSQPNPLIDDPLI